MPQSTRESRQAESAINTVLQSLIESQEALVVIGEKLEDGILKRFCLAESLKRAEFREDLEAALNQEGLSAMRESNTSVGIAHRAWAWINSRLGGGDQALLAIAELGEDATEEAYLSAVGTVLPLRVRQLLSTQVMDIRESHNHVKVARDQVDKNAA